MEDRSIELLFEQFRRRGDVAALGVVFDRTAPELFRVAQHLAGDVHAAEDALQSAFLAAIEHAHTWDASRPLLPWLLGVLANRVRELRRARRELDPERVTAQPHADPEADAHARELAAAVEHTLTELPDPYRDVLTRHLRDGRTPAEIASELGRAPGTVRVQLSRGLELVRRALPPSFALAGAALANTGRGQAAVRAAVLEGAAEQLASASAHVASAHVASSHVASSHVARTQLAQTVSAASTPMKLALTGAAVAVAFAVYFFPGSAAREPRSVAEASASVASPARRADAPANDVELAARRVSVGDATRATTATAPAPGIWIVGRVLGADGVDRARLSIEASTPQLAPHEPVAVQADGSFAIDVTRIVQEDEAPATCRVALTLNTEELVDGRAELVLGPEITRQLRDARSEVRCDVTAVVTCGLRGRVAEPEEREDAIVVLYTRTADGGLDPRFISGRPTEDGVFEVRTRNAGLHRLLLTAPPLAPLALDVQLVPGHWADVGTLSPTRGGVDIAGTLQLPPGVSVAGATVFAERRYDVEPDATFGHVALFREHVELASQFAEVAPDGTFRIAGLAPGAYDVNLVDVPSVDGDFADVLAANVQAPVEELVLGAALQLLVVEVEHDGQPVRARTEWTFGPEPRTATTHVRGRERFLVSARDDVTIVAHSGNTYSDSVHVPARERASESFVTLDPTAHTPPSGTLVLALTTEADAPRRVRVRLTPRVGETREPVALDLALDGDGYVANAVAPGEYSAAVEPLEDDAGVFFTSFSHFAALDIAITEGQATRCVLSHDTGGRIRVRCAGAAVPGAVATFVIRDARGRAHALRAVYRTSDEDVFWDGADERRLPLDRECELFPNLPPGVYVLEIVDSPFTATPVSVAVRAREITTAVLTLTPR